MGFFDDTWNSVKDAGSSVGGFFNDAGSSVRGFFNNVGNTFSDAFSPLGQGFADIGNFLYKEGGILVDAFNGAASLIANPTMLIVAVIGGIIVLKLVESKL